ncbi:MAG: hypothetical protein AAB221_13645 [Bacteroidota bacterium]
MLDYLKWNEQTISDFTPQNITALYNDGYLFTRLGKGIMHQTRSLRIDLAKFELSSENRRILRKTNSLLIAHCSLPMTNYNWQIGKMAKDFYDIKFGKGIFSANKIKELLTDERRSNFNTLIQYDTKNSELRTPNSTIGYAICYKKDDILHYCYPFYQLAINNEQLANIGLGMMLRAILYAKEQGLRYIYIGSAQRPTDTYKLQFEGLEWFDGKEWKTSGGALKKLLAAQI